MTQNRSAAVMQQRHEAPDSLDDFPTAPWATRALCEVLTARGHLLHLQHAWEPACNRGWMARPLGEYFDQVHATDVHDYGWSGQDGQADFLIDWGQDVPDVDWVITNPPFRLAAEFILQGLRVARVGVAVFVRTAFVEGRGRYDGLFRDLPETLFLPFVERVALWRGVLLDPDIPVWRPDPEDPETGEYRLPTSATSYAWLVWLKDPAQPGVTELQRIAPCRRRLTQPGDYPPVPDHLRGPQGGLL
jgi:hypothetical protein